MADLLTAPTEEKRVLGDDFGVHEPEPVVPSQSEIVGMTVYLYRRIPFIKRSMVLRSRHLFVQRELKPGVFSDQRQVAQYILDLILKWSCGGGDDGAGVHALEEIAQYVLGITEDVGFVYDEEVEDGRENPLLDLVEDTISEKLTRL